MSFPAEFDLVNLASQRFGIVDDHIKLTDSKLKLELSQIEEIQSLDL